MPLRALLNLEMGIHPVQHPGALVKNLARMVKVKLWKVNFGKSDPNSSFDLDPHKKKQQNGIALLLLFFVNSLPLPSEGSGTKGVRWDGACFYL